MSFPAIKREDEWQVPLGIAVAVSLVFHVVGIPLLMFLFRVLELLQPVVIQTPAPIDIDITYQEPEEQEPVVEEEPAEEEAEEEAEPEPEPPEPEPEPEVEEQPPPPRPVEPDPEPPPPAEEPPPEPPEPVDFTGLTLTGGSGGFAVVAGDGSDREGPLGPPPRRREPTGVPGGTPGGMGTGPVGTGTGPRVVASRDLSRQPRQPDGLGALLRENYPQQARAQGVEGVARVRIRINPNGSLSNLRVVSETPEGYGFGQACIRTLTGAPRFDPPLDREGNPVATVKTFPCTFSVRY